jgi:hypothetical protein
MDMLETLRQQPKNRDNVRAAVEAINNTELSFSEKFERVQQLEDNSKGFELALFGDVYSSLHTMAITPEDINLMSGI